ncbi:MAG TPA: 3'-5' exonuclease, partial [Clostridia bacterium]
TDIQSFLNRIQQLEYLFDEKTPVRHKRSITMTTLHSSKGLEFDCVFMVDLANSEIPGKKALEASKREKDDSLLEEERRLFYVGMTRAKRYLYLLNHDSKKSIFIDEVNDCIIRKIKDGLSEGVMAFHKKYGVGAIVSIHEDIKGRLILDIDFGGIVRKLDFDVCIDKGLLSF